MAIRLLLVLTWLFTISPVMSAPADLNPPGLPSASLCQNGSWSYSSGTYTCTGRIVFPSGVTYTSKSTVTFWGNEGITVGNAVIGSSKALIHLRSDYGSISVTGNSNIRGNITTSSGAITIAGTYLYGTLTTNSTLNVSNSTMTAAVSALNGVTATSTTFNSTLTANSGSINLTGGRVDGKIQSNCCSLTTNNTSLYGGATIQSGISITGGTIAGGFALTAFNGVTLSSVTMTSGAITGASAITISNSTIGSASSPVTMTSNTGAITMSNTTSYGTFTAPSYSEVILNTGSTVTGNCYPNSEDCTGAVTPEPENCPIPESGSQSLAGKVIFNEVSFHGDTANGDWFELYVNEGVHNLAGWKVKLKGRGGINQTITLPNVTIPWTSSANGKFIIFAASTNDSAIQRAIELGVLQQNVNLFLIPGIELHNTLQEMLLTDTNDNLVYYLGYANNSSTANNFDYSCAEDFPQFADTIEDVGQDDTACTTVDGESAYTENGDWSAGCSGNTTIGYTNDGDSITEETFVNKYRVEHITTATIGQPVTLTIKACISDDCSSLLPGTVTGQIAIQSGAGTLSSTSITFSGGQTTVQLTPTAAGTITFVLSNMQVQSSGIALVAATPVCLNVANSADSFCQIAAVSGETCFAEGFSDYANWYPTVVNSTPPALVDGRLQLTTNAQNQSTSITFRQGFPAAGNKLKVEFDHYAYNGSGADGIALVFSDAEVNPVPGSYGGSLGYAQRTNVSPSQPGFAGGWLGIGFDEYGNFSQETEGRNGGVVTIRPNAIGVRGAASTNYVWLGGSSTLSPVLGASGATPGRGDRYRVTIDSATDPAKVAFLLERQSAGSASYSPILSSTDLTAGGHPAPPQNLLLSFTGSTGDFTNVHAIDNVSVCTVLPPASVNLGEEIHHFQLSYNSGVTCESNEVEVKACLNAECTALYSGQVNLSLSATAGATWPSDSTLSFNNGQGTALLAKTTVGTSLLAIAASNLSQTNPVQCIDSGTLDSACSVQFNDASLQFSFIPNQVAGAWSSESNILKVVETIPETGVCSSRVVPAANVQMGYQCTNPTACIAGQELRVTDTDIDPVEETILASNDLGAINNYQDVSLSFSNAENTYALMYTDVGKIRLKARLALAATATQPAVTLEALSNEFVVRPHRINVTAALSSTTANPANAENPQTYGTDSGFVAAGEAFQVYAAPLNALGDLTPNYGNEDEAESVELQFGELLHPVGGEDGELTAAGGFNKVSSGTFNNQFRTTDVRWDEVGTITLLAKVEGGDYLGTGLGAAVESDPYTVGRFYPMRFSLISSALENTCSAFSYMGQPAIKLVYEIQAKNLAGNKTLNYHGGYSDTLAEPVAAFENTSPAMDLTSRVDMGTLPAWNEGSYLFSRTDLIFSKLAAADGPYAAVLAELQLTDELDQRVLEGGTADECGDDCSVSPVTGTLDVRFGRLFINSGIGDENEQLRVTVEAQYWNGSNFVRNSLDNCTTFDPEYWGAVKALDPAAPSAPANIDLSGNPSVLVDGVSLPNAYWLVPPAVRSKYILQCAGTIAQCVQQSWLQYDWNGDATIDDDDLDNGPEFVFGLRTGNKRQIFWQERLN